uniref:Uncharacterized protein n=1 Tax=Anguilla anguilla TaxID=7936 RepID=A0A0E9X1V7_ANGAN
MSNTLTKIWRKSTTAHCHFNRVIRHFNGLFQSTWAALPQSHRQTTEVGKP